MVIFYILLLVPILMQHIKIEGYRSDYQKRNIKALTFFFALLTLLVMLRHESIGNDTSNYIYYFDKFSRMKWRELVGNGSEIGFAILNKAVSLISLNPQVYFAVAAIAVTAMIYPTYKRLCVDSSLTIVLYCLMSTFVMMFSGIRQMLAVGIGFFAYEFTRRHKFTPFLLMVLLSVTMHTSGFMLLFMYPLYHARVTKNWLYVIVPVLAVIFVFNRQVFSVLSLILERYTKYDAAVSSTGAYTMLILFAAFTAFAFLVPKESEMDEETIGMRNFLILSLAIQMFAPLHTLAMRMNYYYIIFIPLLIPRIVQYRSGSWNRIAILGRHIMVVFFLVYFFINAQGDGNLNVFPYHFFWENVIGW